MKRMKAMKAIHGFILVLVTILVLSATALAVPQLINYQGKLTDMGGAALNATVSMTFRLYDDPVLSGPNMLWSETHPSVEVTGGSFSVSLGSIDPVLNPLPVEAFDSSALYLGVEVENDGEMAPRAQLVSVPYAMRALSAACNPGDFINCYSGDPATMGIGECTSGVRICDQSGSFGTCEGEVAPITEVCGDALDNDCDGEVDEGCVRYIFIANNDYVANLGGLSGADAKCQTAANAGSFTSGLGLTWTAVLSSETVDARDRVGTFAYPLYNTNGDLIANGSDDLWDGAIANAVYYTEDAQMLERNVFSGSTSAGLKQSGYTCSSWTALTPGGELYQGRSGMTNAEWIEYYWASDTCQYSIFSLYCISDPAMQ